MLQPRKQNPLCPVVAKFVSKYDFESPRKIMPGNWEVFFLHQIVIFLLILYFSIRKNKISLTGFTLTPMLWYWTFHFSILTFDFLFLKWRAVWLKSPPTQHVLSSLLYFFPQTFVTLLDFFFYHDWVHNKWGNFVIVKYLKLWTTCHRETQMVLNIKMMTYEV